MKNEISELLQGITKEEFEKFSDFIKSPYFNKLPRLIKLYDYLCKNYDKLQNGLITRESISLYMYPNEEFKNESIKKLLSDFAHLLERFLAQEEFEKNEWDKKIYILRGLRIRHYDDKFFKRLKEFKASQKNSTQEIDELYETNTKLISEEYDYYFNSNLVKNNHINQEKSNALDNEFAVKKLYLFQYMASREYVNKDLKFNYDFFNEITHFVNENKRKIVKENPEIYRNFLGVKFIKNSNDKTLAELKLFIENQKYLQRNIAKPYWDFINLCMLKINKGADNYYDNIFHYVSLLDKHNLILKDKSFNCNCFRISVSAALYCKELEWLKDFTLKYQNKIEIEYRDDIVHLTYARIHFENREFEESKKYCRSITYKNYFFYLAAKNILLKIAYLQQDFLSLTTLKDAYFKYFESHSEIPATFKTGKIEFANYLIELGKIRENFELRKKQQFELDKLIGKVKDDEVVNNKEWLLSVAKELKKNS